MKTISPSLRSRRQRGSAAVELAILLMATFFILPTVFLFGRVFYHYNVIKQATQDAAIYMAALPRPEISTQAGLDGARARARQMVMDAVAVAGITPPESLVVDVQCNGGTICIAAIPLTDVEVTAGFSIFDGFWQITYNFLPDDGNISWTFITSSTAVYLN